MKHLKTILLITILSGGGLVVAPHALAAEHSKHSMHKMHGKGHGMHQAYCWKSTLSEDQKKQLTKLKLNHKKNVLPIKASIRQAKVAIALLVTADTPDQKAIESKIDEIAKLKGIKMRLKAAHKIEVRKILDDEQRVNFDMKLLKKAYHGKKGHHKKDQQHSRH